MNAILDRWFRTWPERVGAALVAALAVVMALLGLMGYEIGFWSLTLLLGLILGNVSAYSLSVPFRERFARSLGSWANVVVFALGFALALVLLLVGLLFVGLPLFFTDEGGMLGTLVYGLALGVPHGLKSGLVAEPQPGPEIRQNREAAVQGIKILGGMLATLLVLAVGLYLFIEFIVAPLTRYLAG